MEYNASRKDMHKLNSEWTLWAHLPHDIDWSIKSYKKILDIKYLEEAVVLMESLPGKMIKNCMLFLMRLGKIRVPIGKNFDRKTCLKQSNI